MDTTRLEALIRNALAQPRDVREAYISERALDDTQLREAATIAMARLDEASTEAGMDITHFEALVTQSLEKLPSERETFLLEQTHEDAAWAATVAAITQPPPEGPATDRTSAQDTARFDSLVRQALALDADARETYLREHSADDRELREEVLRAVERVESRLASVDVDVGDEIGPYLLAERLGEGGMGAVYLAQQTEPVERLVALKCIKPGVDSKELLMRFESERRTLAIMSHPNVATVFDAGVTPQGRPYFAMEYVPGVEITKYCDRKTLNLRERVELFIQACEGVEHAHQKGIIHRDLKPSNILVTEKSERPLVKIIDFGIAKSIGGGDDQTALTMIGGFIGTPLYASPEQAEISGGELDTRTDVYSLGIILYELLVGRFPFNAQALKGRGVRDIQAFLQEIEPPTPESRFSSLRGERERIARARALSAGAVRKELRGDLGWIVMRALEKARDDRYASVDAFVSDLKRYLADLPVEAHAPTFRYRAAKFVRRHRVAVTTAALVAIATVGVAISSTVLFLEAKEQRFLAEQNSERAERRLEVFFDMLQGIQPEDVVDGRIDADKLIRDGAVLIEERLADAPGHQARFFIDLADVWYAINPWLSEELLDLAERSLDQMSDPTQALTLRSEHFVSRAYIAELIGTTEQSMDHATAALALARQSGDPRSILNALKTTTEAQIQVGDFAAVSRSLEERLQMLRSARAGLSVEEHQSMLGNTWVDVARTEELLGQLEQSAEALEKARIAYEAAGDDYGLMDVRYREAGLAHSFGDYRKALDSLRPIMAAERESNDIANLTISLMLLAETLSDYGDLRGAETAYREGMRLAGETNEEALLMHGLGLVLMESGRLDEARVMLDQAAEAIAASEGEESDFTAIARLSRAMWFAQEGNLGAPQDLIDQAEPMLINVFGQDSTWVRRIEGLRAVVRLRAGDSSALDTLDDVLEKTEYAERSDRYSRFLARAVIDAVESPDPRWVELSVSEYERARKTPE